MYEAGSRRSPPGRRPAVPAASAGIYPPVGVLAPDAHRIRAFTPPQTTTTALRLRCTGRSENLVVVG